MRMLKKLVVAVSFMLMMHVSISQASIECLDHNLLVYAFTRTTVNKEPILNKNDLEKCSLVCKHWYRATASDDLWKSRAALHFQFNRFTEEFYEGVSDVLKGIREKKLLTLESLSIQPYPRYRNFMIQHKEIKRNVVLQGWQRLKQKCTDDAKKGYTLEDIKLYMCCEYLGDSNPVRTLINYTQIKCEKTGKNTELVELLKMLVEHKSPTAAMSYKQYIDCGLLEG